MPAHRSFFAFSCAFLFGVLLKSFGLYLWSTFLVAFIIFFLLYFFDISRKVAVLTAIFIFLGSFYYAVDDFRYHSKIDSLPGEDREFIVVIDSEPEMRENHQLFYASSEFGRVLVRTVLYPQYHYGDELRIFGSIDRPPNDGYGHYLAKERVVGSSFFPKIDHIRDRQGNPVLTYVHGIKNNIQGSINRHFNRDQAAIISGIMLGDRTSFSEDLLEKLSLSGTRHLTAISGLHMTIVVFLFSMVFSYLLPRKYAFVLTFLFVILFVAMTGFKVSAMRSALMGFIGGTAKELGKSYAQYNALVLAALLLVLFNPKILFFDIGFQLSFLAVVSIMYFMPALKTVLRFDSDPGFLRWKDSFLVTASAQLAVAPILITQFGIFSLSSFLANVLILVFIPLLLSLSFIFSIISFVSYHLTYVVSLAMVPIVEYVMLIIRFFANSSFILNINLTIVGIVIYYMLIALLIWITNKKQTDHLF